MAPATLELLLLGLMHFALARLDIWHWKVLHMLLQNSSILTAAAFLPSATTDGCSWDGSPCSWVNQQEVFRWLRPVFHLPSCSQVDFYLLTSARCQVVALWPPDGALAWAGVDVRAAVPAWELTQAGFPTSQVILGGYWPQRQHVEHTELHL